MYYKYLHKKYVESLLDGNLVFGRSRYYQLLEQVTGNDIIGDCLESSATTHCDIEFFDFESMNEKEKAVGIDALKNIGINHPGSGSINVSNMSNTQRVDCYIFSLVLCSDLKQLKNESHKFEYDGCVKFTNLEKVKRKIWKQGVVENLNGDIIGLVRDIFEKIECGVVEYGNLTQDFKKGILTPSVFLKQTKYCCQNEYRIVLFPKETIREDHLKIKVGDINNCCESVPELACNVVSVDMYSECVSETAEKYFYYADKLCQLSNINICHAINRNFGGSVFDSMQEGHQRNVLERDSRKVSNTLLGEYPVSLNDRDAIVLSLVSMYWELRKTTGSYEPMDQDIVRSKIPIVDFPRSVVGYISYNYEFFQECLPHLLPRLICE